MEEPNEKPTKQDVLNTISDLVSGFLYYDRKEDETLPRGAIEALVESGKITVDEIVGAFRSGVEEHFKRADPED